MADVLAAVMITEPGSSLDFTPYHIYSGSMCMVTGQPGFTTASPPTTPPLNPYTNADQDDWGEGLLFADKLGNPTHSLDMTELGSYGNQSDLSIEIPNLNGRYHNLRGVGFNLNRAEVRYFIVLDGVFYLRWTGEVTELGYSITSIKIKAKGFFANAHTTVPKLQVDYAVFPQAAETAIGKPIPICYGEVTRAMLLPVQSISYPEVIAEFDGDPYTGAPVIGSIINNSGYALRINTGSLVVAINQWAGLWCIVSTGGPREGRRIAANTAADGSGTTSVFIVLENPFVANDGGAALTPPAYTSPAATNVWWVQVKKMYFPHVLSDSRIGSIERNPDDGSPILDSYDSDLGEWVDVSGMRHWQSLLAISGSPYPGFEIYSSDMNETKAQVAKRKFIRPSAVELIESDYGYQNYSTKTGITVTTPLTNGVKSELRDMSRTTGISLPIRFITPTSNMTELLLLRMQLRIDFDAPPFNLGFEDVAIHLLGSVDFVGDSGNTQGPSFGNVYADIAGVDLADTATVNIASASIWDGEIGAGSPGDGTVSLAGIPIAYHSDDFVGAATHEVKQSKAMSIKKIISGQGSFNPYKSLVLDIEASVGVTNWGLTAGSQNDVTFTINEIVLIGRTNIGIAVKNASTKCQGRVFPDSWGGRVTSGAVILNPVDVIEDLIREQDGRPDLIDEDAFDDARAYFDTIQCRVGRQITEAKSSGDHIRDLCRQTDLFVAPGFDGKLKPLLPFNASSTFTLSPATVLFFGDPQAVDSRKFYNEFDISWNYDPGPNRYRSRIQVLNTDQDFPDFDEFDGGTSSVTFTNYRLTGDSTRLRIVLPTGQSLYEGQWINFTGGEDGLEFTLIVDHATKYASGETWVFVDASTLSGFTLTPETDYTSGTLVRLLAGAPKWTTMIQGFPAGYEGAGEYLHDNSAIARAISKAKQILKMELSWFSNVEDWGDLWNLNNAYSLIVRLILSRIGYPRFIIPFTAPITSTTLAWYVGQRGTFNFGPITNGDAPCWIQRLTVNPRGLNGKGVIEGEAMYLLDGPLT